MVKEKQTNMGFPVYIRLVDGKNRFKRCVAHSFLEHWDYEAQKPLKSHTAYFEILPKILEYHAKVKKINFGNYSFVDAKILLVGEVELRLGCFYESGLKLVDGSKTGELYETVLKSFNLVFPLVLLKEITPKMAQTYMDLLLKTNRPNGVHAYMSKLHAIYNKVSGGGVNPFKGIKPRKVKTAKRGFSDNDLNKIIYTRTLVLKEDFKNTNDSINDYRNYWLLLFYLGGINFVDLAHMRYDLHVADGRVQFNRNKGGTNTFINNMIVPQAMKILKKYNCYPYLVPIFKAKKLDNFRNRMNRRLIVTLKDLDLPKNPTTYTARHSFINRARQLMVDERVCIEIVGHEQQKTHSIYADEYPLHVRDEAHLKIVGL